LQQKSRVPIAPFQVPEIAMTDFAAARRMMVDGQVRPSDITDPRIINAMFELPRERFVSERRAGIAYLDLDVPVGDSEDSRRLLKPMVLAKLIQAADISPTDRVLDVGCASGYSSVLLSKLAGHVVGLEEEAALVRQAEAAIAASGTANVQVIHGPLATGAASEGPYDVIVMQGATEVVPVALLDQLHNGGRLVCVLGRGQSGKGMLYRLIEDEFSGRPLFDAAAPLLPGFAQRPEFVF
jgi:protein-L-isoaspartate(D-aspartate) O-methyltransferase